MKRFVLLLIAASAALGGGDTHARGFGGYHGGYATLPKAGFGPRDAFPGYHGGFGVGGLYEGALDGPRGFSGYGANWSGFRNGYGLGTTSGYQGGYNLGYKGAGGLPGYDNNIRPGPWSHGIAGRHEAMGVGPHREHLARGFPNFLAPDLRANRFGTLPSPAPSQFKSADQLVQPGGIGRPGYDFGLPTDQYFHAALGSEHSLGYLGDARGLTAFDPARDDAAPPTRNDSQNIPQATPPMSGVTRPSNAADLRRDGNVARRTLRAEAAFGPTWYDDYAGAWIAKNIVSDVWTPAAWTTLNRWFNNNAPAISYNYGSDITYDTVNGNVNLYGLPVATAAAYYDSAAALAAKGSQSPPMNVQWLPLGVFGAIREGNKTTDMMFQLAVDKAGVLRGNYFNIADKNNRQIEGAVDQKTQRVAWIVKDRTNIIFDTGLYNLTKDESAVLVHLGKDKTEQWTLVRVKHIDNNSAAKK